MIQRTFKLTNRMPRRQGGIMKELRFTINDDMEQRRDALNPRQTNRDIFEEGIRAFEEKQQLKGESDE